MSQVHTWNFNLRGFTNFLNYNMLHYFGFNYRYFIIVRGSKRIIWNVTNVFDTWMNPFALGDCLMSRIHGHHQMLCQATFSCWTSVGGSQSEPTQTVPRPDGGFDLKAFLLWGSSANYGATKLPAFKRCSKKFSTNNFIQVHLNCSVWCQLSHALDAAIPNFQCFLFYHG